MLIAAAARVMARDGIAQTTTRAITAEADMPRGSFHYCFRSKDELLRELAVTVVADMVRAAQEAQTDTGDLSADLRAALRAMFTAVTEHPDEQLVLYELTTYALRDPETVELARWQYESYLRQAIDYLGYVADRAQIRWTLPMPVLARLLVNTVDGLALNWLSDRDTDVACQVLDAFAVHLTSLAVPST